MRSQNRGEKPDSGRSPRFCDLIRWLCGHLRAEPPGPGMVALLDLPPGAPVLRIHRIAYAIGDKPVELRFGYVNTARHEYRASLV